VTFVRYEVRDRIAYFTFDRPERHNAMTDEGLLELVDRLADFDADDDAFVGILSGLGPSFSSGGDLQSRLLASADGPAGGQRSSESDAILHAPRAKPLIAAIHGYCLGHALGTALQCDAIVAGEDAVFEFTEALLGVPVAGIWAVLLRATSQTFATEVAMTGRRFSAAEAHAAGMVTVLAPPGEHLSAAESLARQVLRVPPLAMRSTIRARRSMLAQEMARASEAAGSFRWEETEDYREAVEARIAKREPTFRGR
jgi:enoyl-CoA hydratase/carnithine racemase